MGARGLGGEVRKRAMGGRGTQSLCCYFFKIRQFCQLPQHVAPSRVHSVLVDVGNVHIEASLKPTCHFGDLSYSAFLALYRNLHGLPAFGSWQECIECSIRFQGR